MEIIIAISQDFMKLNFLKNQFNVKRLKNLKEKRRKKIKTTK